MGRHREFIGNQYFTYTKKQLHANLMDVNTHMHQNQELAFMQNLLLIT